MAQLDELDSYEIEAIYGTTENTVAHLDTQPNANSLHLKPLEIPELSLEILFHNAKQDRLAHMEFLAKKREEELKESKPERRQLIGENKWRINSSFCLRSRQDRQSV